jgi:hypothetical protein
MGDTHRNEVFCSFILKQYPRIKSVLCVADGKAELARCFANKGIEATVIENSPRMEGRKHPLIHYRKGWFTRHHHVTEDIVVGMHPDEATGEILLAGEKSNRPWAIVPCCTKGELASGVHGYEDWLKRLKGFCGHNCREQVLKISGKNRVLYK